MISMAAICPWRYARSGFFFFFTVDIILGDRGSGIMNMGRLGAG